MRVEATRRARSLGDPAITRLLSPPRGVPKTGIGDRISRFRRFVRSPRSFDDVPIVVALRSPGGQDPTALLTELNVPLTLVPRFVTTVTQATTIRASMTAYSTAVGP